MSIFAIDKLPTTTQEAITVFNDRYAALQEMGRLPMWANELGDMVPTDSPKATFPYSQLSVTFRETTGEQRFKNFLEGSFDLKTIERDAGIEANFYQLTKSPWLWSTWQKGPAKLMAAEQRLILSLVSTLLGAGDTATCKPTNANFFDAAHQANPAEFGSSKTFSNLDTNATDVVDIDNITAQATAMEEGVLDENGEIMQVTPDTIICHPHKARPLRNLLRKELVNSGDTNPEAGEWRVISAPRLPSTVDWYMLDSALCADLPPWIVLEEMVAEALELRVFDESSEKFREDGKIAVSKHIWKGAGLVFPYGIRKVTGA